MTNSSRGRYFEEFNPGDKFISGSRVINEDDIEVFSELSGDYNRIHTDREYAKEFLYGERIAHGLLSLAMVSGLASRLGFTKDTIISFREINWKFRQPVKIGDSIEGSFIVDKKRDLAGSDGGIVNFRVRVTNQKNELVQSGRWSLIIKNRP